MPDSISHLLNQFHEQAILCIRLLTANMYKYTLHPTALGIVLNPGEINWAFVSKLTGMFHFRVNRREALGEVCELGGKEILLYVNNQSLESLNNKWYFFDTQASTHYQHLFIFTSKIVLIFNYPSPTRLLWAFISL